MTFGEKLQKLRQREGLSQDMLSEKLEVSRLAVSRWERNETMPETATLLRIAVLFHVSTDYLLREDGELPTAAQQQKGDWMERLSWLVKMQGYLLGYALAIWGGLDLLQVLVFGVFLGNLGALLPDFLTSEQVFATMVSIPTRMLWIPGVYGIIKIIAGLVAAHYAKQYANKIRRDTQ